jgi:hypothetical protein
VTKKGFIHSVWLDGLCVLRERSQLKKSCDVGESKEESYTVWGMFTHETRSAVAVGASRGTLSTQTAEPPTAR